MSRGLLPSGGRHFWLKKFSKAIPLGIKITHSCTGSKNQTILLTVLTNYLADVYRESIRRNYNFNRDKIKWDFERTTLPITRGQLKHESIHLLKKLKVRDVDCYKSYITKTSFDTHPLFKVVDGDIEKWEKLK